MHISTHKCILVLGQNIFLGSLDIWSRSNHFTADVCAYISYFMPINCLFQHLQRNKIFDTMQRARTVFENKVIKRISTLCTPMTL